MVTHDRRLWYAYETLSSHMSPLGLDPTLVSTADLLSILGSGQYYVTQAQRHLSWPGVDPDCTYIHTCKDEHGQVTMAAMLHSCVHSLSHAYSQQISSSYFVKGAVQGAKIK